MKDVKQIIKDKLKLTCIDNFIETNNTFKKEDLLILVLDKNNDIKSIPIDSISNYIPEILPISPTIHIISEGDFIVPDGTRTRIITLTDSNPQIVTLPSIENSIGAIYFITNSSSDGLSKVNVVSNTGDNELWDGSVSINNKELTFGMSLRFFNDSTNFKIIG